MAGRAGGSCRGQMGAEEVPLRAHVQLLQVSILNYCLVPVIGCARARACSCLLHPDCQSPFLFLFLTTSKAYLRVRTWF